jgi:opacity protein-like surface antigen
MINNFRRLLAAIIVILFVTPAFSQVDPFINLGAGYDYNFNKYYNENGYIRFENATDYNAGGDFGLQLGKNARFHAVFNYVQFTYGKTPRDTSVFYSEAKMRISSLSLTPALDIRVWSHKKLDLYVTAGYLMEWVVDMKETNQLKDGGTTNLILMKKDYNSFISGPAGGIILKYNISKNLGITFEPTYTYFLKKFYEPENDLNLQRISVGIGVEYLFLLKHKKKTEGFEE